MYTLNYVFTLYVQIIKWAGHSPLGEELLVFGSSLERVSFI